MRRPAKLVLSSVLFALLGCASGPPSVVNSGLVVAPALEELRPSQIAILPIADGTPQLGFGALADVAREGVEARLAERAYSPLAPRYVDQKLVSIGKSPGDGRLEEGASPVDVGWLGSVRNAFLEDAVLGVRVVEWNVRRVVETRRVGFVLEVLMLGSETGAVLWSGRLEGDVKAGGEGPSPLSRDQRILSAARLMGEILAEQLPVRRPG